MGKLYEAPREEWPREAGWLVPDFNCTELQYQIVLRAMRDVGIVEVPNGSNRGTRIDRYAKRAGSPLGSWWCAIWTGAVYVDCGALVPRVYPSCDEWLEYLVAEPCIGAAVLYGLKKNGKRDAHHIGIVARLPEPETGQRLQLTIEGNRGYAGTTNNGIAVDIGPMIRTDVLGYFHPRTALGVR